MGEIIELIPDSILYIFMFLLGSFFGSFLNVVIYRLPRKCLSIFKPSRSFCPKCMHKIAWFENIPIISFVFLNGKCRHCSAKISFRYPLVEFLTALLFMLFFYRDIMSVPPETLDYQHWLSLVTHLSAVVLLLAIAFIDFDLKIIPHSLSLGGAVLMLIFAVINPFHGGYIGNFNQTQTIKKPVPEEYKELFGDYQKTEVSNYELYARVANQPPVNEIDFAVKSAGKPEKEIKPVQTAQNSDKGSPEQAEKLNPHLRSFLSALFGAFAGGIGLLLLNLLMTLVFWKKAQKYGGGFALGFGDVMLMIFFGAMLGWPCLPIIVILASFIGLFFGIPLLLMKSKHIMPFGPSLVAAAILLTLFYGPVLNWISVNIFQGMLFY